MNTFFALLLTSLSHAAPLPKMQFTYEPVEGEAPSSCTHVQISDLPDWDVNCVTPYGTKTYTVHVIVREYPRASDTGLEILYWITEPGDTETSSRKYHSTTAFFHLNGATSLSDFSLSQGVENDQSSLTLGWEKPNQP